MDYIVFWREDGPQTFVKLRNKPLSATSLKSYLKKNIGATAYKVRWSMGKNGTTVNKIELIDGAIFLHPELPFSILKADILEVTNPRH